MNKVLEDREIRYNEILLLIEKYKLPVVCGKINYPGAIKNTPLSEKAFKVLISLITGNFGDEIAFLRTLEGFDGRSIIAAVDIEAEKAKEMAADIEEDHELGRIFDIDVYSLDGSSVGRESIGINPRGCIVCGETARLCMKSERHRLQEVLEKVNGIIDGYGEEYGF